MKIYIGQTIEELRTQRDLLTTTIRNLETLFGETTEPEVTPIAAFSAKFESLARLDQAPLRKAVIRKPVARKVVRVTTAVPAAPVKSVATPWPASARQKGIRDYVREVIATMPEPFDCVTVAEALAKAYPNLLKDKKSGTVSTILLQLFQSNELIRAPRVEGQSGPSAYRRLKTLKTTSVPRDPDVEVS